MVERRGVPAAVLSGFSVDIRNDIIEQAARLQTDVLVVEPGDHASRVDWRPDLLDGAAGKLVVVRSEDPGADLASQGPVVVVTESGQDADATLALAAHVARSRGIELRLVDGGRRRRPRRLSALASRLTDAGLPCTAAESVDDLSEVLASGSSLVFLEARGDVALSAATMGTVLLVRAAPDALDDELDAAITHLRGGLARRPIPALNPLD